jgi:hypothetical protein
VHCQADNSVWGNRLRRRRSHASAMLWVASGAGQVGESLKQQTSAQVVRLLGTLGWVMPQGIWRAEICSPTRDLARAVPSTVGVARVIRCWCQDRYAPLGRRDRSVPVGRHRRDRRSRYWRHYRGFRRFHEDLRWCHRRDSNRRCGRCPSWYCAAILRDQRADQHHHTHHSSRAQQDQRRAHAGVSP